MQNQNHNLKMSQFKGDTTGVLKNHIRQEIITESLSIKALIQDISKINGPLELLNELNAEGRAKLTVLRKQIDQLETLAKETLTAPERLSMLNEAESYRQQFTGTLAAFRQTNVCAMLRIEKAAKLELMNRSNDGDNEKELQARKRKDKASLAKLSTSVTDQLLSISRNLADTTQRSAETLEALGNSSTGIHGTRDELMTTSSVIKQSGTLLAKYGRRELTDKVLLFFAFAFFFACVLYIVHKRLF